ncbi:hypothetical protein [Iningainema tapete]|uniref:Uncharacterized protein n=1 Tax=Iningainema tapete BLCC-T55 TaxID=2748662 RepID=A0A8J6XV32_9CYAN|nr:hypothetical protein [Iningainema tapete]MBD2778960.1 hypothetical protein [Iningainema tapete BLCC-T55]
MSKPKTYQPTPAQLEHWKKLDEIEQFAISGLPISEEQKIKNVQELIDPNYLQNQLDELRIYKQKLLKKLAWIEEREQLLVKEIQQ